ERAHGMFRQILCRGEPAEFTLHIRDAADELVPVEISSAPVRDDESVVGVFGLVRRADPPEGDAPAPSTATELLTPRQLEVLRLLAQGASTHEIAAKLHLSTTTVRNHVQHVLAALGAHTRLQAVISARERGILDG